MFLWLCTYTCLFVSIMCVFMCTSFNVGEYVCISVQPFRGQGLHISLSFYLCESGLLSIYVLCLCVGV